MDLTLNTNFILELSCLKSSECEFYALYFHTHFNKSEFIDFLKRKFF